MTCLPVSGGGSGTSQLSPSAQPTPPMAEYHIQAFHDLMTTFGMEMGEHAAKLEAVERQAAEIDDLDQMERMLRTALDCGKAS